MVNFFLTFLSIYKSIFDIWRNCQVSNTIAYDKLTIIKKSRLLHVLPFLFEFLVVLTLGIVFGN